MTGLSTGPRVTHPRPEVGPGAAEQAAADLLTALGLDLNDENLAETPRRMAHALIEMTSGSDFELTTFPNDEGYDQLVLVRDIPLQSVCEHHMLPLVGVAHIGYLPGDRILGLSKFARMVDLHARRPQTQERPTKRIADHLQGELQPRGVGVVIEAERTCMSLRGARAPAPAPPPPPCSASSATTPEAARSSSPSPGARHEHRRHRRRPRRRQRR